MKELPEFFRSLPKEVDPSFHYYKLDASQCEEICFSEIESHFSNEPHTHTRDVICLVTKGKTFINLNGTEKCYSSGEWIVLPKEMMHSVRTEEKTNLIEFWFKNCVAI